MLVIVTTLIATIFLVLEHDVVALATSEGFQLAGFAQPSAVYPQAAEHLIITFLLASPHFTSNSVISWNRIE
jgi:hypothetical protein